MAERSAQLESLYAALGDYFAGGRPDGIFSARLGGPGGVPDLADLEAPELQLDLLPFPPAPQQRAALGRLGYTVAAEDAGRLTFTPPASPDPAALKVVLLSHDLGFSHCQQVLWAELSGPLAGRMRAEYRRVFTAAGSDGAGREAADAALWPAARDAHLERTRFGPLERARALLEPLGLPWMFAAGWALDLHRHARLDRRPSRPHEDTDVIVGRETQMEVRDALHRAGYTLRAVRGGMYTAWDTPLDAPDFQVHAYPPPHPEHMEMLDLMLTDFCGDASSEQAWHYRRDPAIALPMAQARRVSAAGFPYLTPEAALLFKATGANGSVRPKDQQDFERVLPALGAAARLWLSARIGEGHAWQASLNRAR